MQPQTQSNHEPQTAKVLHILARLYYDPTWCTDGQRALLDQVGEPLLAQARDVILAGPAAVTAVTDPTLFDLLHMMQIEHGPSAAAIERRRRLAAAMATTVATGGELAGQLWPDKKPVMTWGAEPDAGEGEWPTPPERTNSEAAPLGTSLVYTPTAAGVERKYAPRYSRKWELDAREYYFRVQREVKKAHAHMAFNPLYYHEFDNRAAFSRWLNTRRTAVKRAQKQGENVGDLVYMTYPFILPDCEALVVVTNHTDGAAGEVPRDRGAAFRLFEPWLNTPENARLAQHSQGYGLNYQGMSGDGRRKMIRNDIRKAAKEAGDQLKETPRGFQFLTGLLPEEVEARLGPAGLIPVDQLDAHFEKMRAALGDVKPRGIRDEKRGVMLRNDAAFDYALQALKAACTQLGDTSDRKNVYAQVGYTGEGESQQNEEEAAGNGRFQEAGT